MSGPSFELHQDGIRLTSYVFGMSFFFSGTPASWGADLVALHDAWVELTGRERFGWYATETMKKHRRASAKTLGMLATWLAPDAPERKYVALMLKEASAHNETGSTVFEVFAKPTEALDSELPGYLHLAARAETALGDLGAMERMFASVCSRLPIISAQGGLGIETSPYFQEQSDHAAWQTSMRHPGLDVFTGLFDRRAVARDGLRSVNWLTAVNEQLLADVGGLERVRRELPSSVAALPCAGGGVIVRAGDAPVVGDASAPGSLASYAAVEAAFRPVIERCVPRAMRFDVPGDDGTYTARWFRRLRVTG